MGRVFNGLIHKIVTLSHVYWLNSVHRCLVLKSFRYLSRVNTARLRANGNESAAKYLLALQKEWRKALHDYDTHGFAVKSDKQKLEKYNLLSKLDKVSNPETKRYYAELLNKDYGLDIALGKQGTLDV